MTRTKIIFALSAIMLVAGLSLSSCKKKKEFKDEDGQSSIDNKNVQSENDAAMNDVSNAIGQQPQMHGRSSQANATNGTAGACGLTIDTTGVNSGSITLNYDGTTCFNRSRSGSIRVSIINYTSGKRWKDMGCSIKIEYIGYKVSRPSDGKSILLNGIAYMVNQSGGSWWELLFIKSQSSLATSINSNNLSVTFEDGKTATYNINRQYTFTLPNGVLTCKGEGFGSSNGLNNLENYGTTRDGDAFTSAVTTPIIWNLTCGPWAPVQGEVNIKVANKDFDLKVTFSVDNNGNTVASSPNACAYGWKVEWSYKKKTRNKVIPYV